MESVTIGNSVTTIGAGAFSGCRSLRSAVIPRSVTVIQSNPFSGCKLDEIKVEDGGNFYFENDCLISKDGLLVLALNKENIHIPESVTGIGESAFNGCSNLQSVYIPNSITAIPPNAFASCTSLATVEIPNSVTEINWTAFVYCTSLRTVVLGSSVESIGMSAFAQCTNITKIISLNPTPPTISSYTFDESIKQKCVLSVPDNVVEAYKAADRWQEFYNIRGLDKEFVKLVDCAPYTVTVESLAKKLNYTRTFTSTNWQALFLPFELDNAEWSKYGTVAELTGATGDVLEWEIVTSSTLTAGKPYIFKPNAAGEVTFTATDKNLYAASQKTDVTVGSFTLSGTYEEMGGMTNYYALAGGMFKRADTDAKTLKPYRIYLSAPAGTPAGVRCRINGEDVTAIEGIEGVDGGQFYNLQGIPVGENYKGIVIKNGKKLVRK